MSRYIGLSVWVEMKSDGQPTAFTWRGVKYRVLECNEPWHLMDRWWVSPAETDANGGKGLSDRRYYRVRAKATGAHSDLFADLYHDRAQGSLWVLEIVHD